ncbi:transmembrane 220 family protein [Mucilaginibacter hurinus]|uniref:transmembrane 220 family protein n=1 Tax=Mucilaginibacter hurinus TaxID=2201324 RepID=UPI0013144573|nr:transmembrane 220 family protein [Mucilaginibacter hurinus]
MDPPIFICSLCFLTITHKYYPLAFYTALIGYLAYAIYKIFDANGVIDWITLHDEESLVQTMKAEKPWIEEAREFFGLLICWIVVLINWVYLKRRAGNN